MHNGHYFCSGKRLRNRCCCNVLAAVRLAFWCAESTRYRAFGYCALLGPNSRVSRASLSKKGLSSRGGHPIGGDYINGRDLGICRATAAGTTSTWCSADSAKPSHVGLTRQKDV